MIGNLYFVYKAVEEMDVEIMSWYFPESLVINDTSKEFLLKKIRNITEVFKQYQNTRLYIRMVRKDAARSEIALVIWGNVSKHYIAITLKYIEENTFKAERYEIDDSLAYLNLEDDFRIDVNFFRDELIGFVPNYNYFKENELYEGLLQELESASQQELDLDEIESWVDCATDAYERLTPYRLQFRNCYLFYKNFNTLLDILALLELEQSVQEGLDSYHEINDSGATDKTEQLTAWSEDFQWLHDELLSLNRYKYLIQPNTSYIKISGLFDIHVGNRELIAAVAFMELFEAKAPSTEAEENYFSA